MSVGLGLKEIRALSAIMSGMLGIPYGHMPVSFFKRRATYFFRKKNIKNIDHFRQLLEKGEISDDIYYDFQVPATEMFRDPGFWRYLRSLLKTFPKNKKITVWFPDEVTGEEVFSFLIIADEIGALDRFKVICQHPSGQRLDDIKNGILRIRNENVNSGNYVRIEGKGNYEDFYSLQNNIFVLNSYLLKNVETLKGHFLQNETTDQAGIIMFRNKMLYYDKEISEKSISVLTENLLPGGLLAIGSKERMPATVSASLDRMSEKEKVFRKHGFEIELDNE
jgi:chemotaxis protein methyltransferase CheR